MYILVISEYLKDSLLYIVMEQSKRSVHAYAKDISVLSEHSFKQTLN